MKKPAFIFASLLIFSLTALSAPEKIGTIQIRPGVTDQIQKSKSGKSEKIETTRTYLGQSEKTRITDTFEDKTVKGSKIAVLTASEVIGISYIGQKPVERIISKSKLNKNDITAQFSSNDPGNRVQLSKIKDLEQVLSFRAEELETTRWINVLYLDKSGKKMVQRFTFTKEDGQYNFSPAHGQSAQPATKEDIEHHETYIPEATTYYVRKAVANAKAQGGSKPQAAPAK